MGMPSISITFAELAKTVVARSEKGIVALIAPTNSNMNPKTYTMASEIDNSLATTTKNAVEMTFLGGAKPPKKVVVFFCNEGYENLSDALKYFETEQFDYMCFSETMETEDYKTVTDWIKGQREIGRGVKVVLPEYVANQEYVINYATKSTTVGEVVYDAAKYAPRIAGLIAGTPITEAATYCQLTDATDCERLTKAEMDEAVDAGKFIIFYDGEYVRVGRAVNSLTTVTPAKPASFKKIKIVDIMDTIKTDITKTIRNNWIGKVANSYNNKCLLVSAVGEYLKDLVDKQVLSEASVEIDVEANKDYLNSVGASTADMTDDDLKRANTGDQVFLKAVIKMVDAMEDIKIEFTI